MRRAWAVAMLCVLVGAACRRAEPTAVPERPQANEAEPVTYDGAEVSASPPMAERERSERATKPEPKGPRPPNTIYRSELERALSGGPGYLLYQLGPEPFRVSGKFVGWEITRLFPDDPSLCDPCDLAIGDVILAVNGDRLETPQAFAAMVERVPKLKAIEVRSLRDEQRRVVEYAVVDD